MKPIFYSVLLAGLLSLTACGWPIDPKSMPSVIESLGKDTASGCFWIGGRGGGGMLTVTPTPIIPGGGAMGSGEVLLGRVNADNTRVTITSGTCTIERGSAPAPLVKATVP